jgi:hypothetical protein
MGLSEAAHFEAGSQISVEWCCQLVLVPQEDHEKLSQTMVCVACLLLQTASSSLREFDFHPLEKCCDVLLLLEQTR